MSDLQAAYAAAVKLAEEAQAEVKASATAIGAAKVAAIHASLVVDPLDRMNAEDTAQVESARLGRIDAALQERLTLRRAAAHRAWGETHRPAYDEAIARRLVACEKADAAAKLQEQAKIEFAAATRSLEAAYAQGLPRPFNGMSLERIGTAEHERALWAEITS